MKTKSVRTELTGIQNWPEFAALAHYRVDELAELVGVNPHALRLFFARTFKTTTKKWLHQERIRECQRRIKSGEPLKNIAGALGYIDAAHLTHDFKAGCGISPREWIKQQMRPAERAKDSSVAPSQSTVRRENVSPGLP